MSKKKFVIIGIMAVLLVGVGTFALTYLFAYKNNDDEIVKFMDNLKLNLDGQYYLFDQNCDELIEEVQFVCNGEGKIIEEGEHDFQVNLNLISSIIPTINYRDCIASCTTLGNCIWLHILGTSIIEEDGIVRPKFEDYYFDIYIDQDDLSNYYIEASQADNEDRYIITNVKDSKEAKELVNNINQKK